MLQRWVMVANAIIASLSGLGPRLAALFTAAFGYLLFTSFETRSAG